MITLRRGGDALASSAAPSERCGMCGGSRQIHHAAFKTMPIADVMIGRTSPIGRSVSEAARGYSAALWSGWTMPMFKALARLPGFGGDPTGYGGPPGLARGAGG